MKKKQRGKKWLQKARKSMEARGTVGSYGSKSEKQERKDIAKGGKLGKKAQFALNMKHLAAKRKRKGAIKRGRKRASKR